MRRRRFSRGVDPKIITLRYATRCAESGAELPAGTAALWYPGQGRVYALDTAAHRQWVADQHDMRQEDDMARACGM